MTSPDRFEIFLMAPPGLEPVLADEAREKGFSDPTPVAGGVTILGDWPDVWRANLQLRGAGRVLARLTSFRAMHLAQLDKRARKVAWSDILPSEVAVRVEATCKQSRIYHAGAAKQRIETAIKETLGVPITPDATMVIRARIEDDLCTISVDTSGELLHKRGHKEAVGKAPMRETLAALFLRQAGFDGSESVVDPMCGSGTFVIEAAEIALGLYPGRSRHFAFEQFANFDAHAWEQLKSDAPRPSTDLRFFGSDRDTGAVRMSTENAARAGVESVTEFTHKAIGDLTPPEGPKGLVIVNPPYGARIGNKKLLFALYGTLGKVLQQRFSGWRAAIITSDAGLARASGLPFLPSGPPVAHGGLRVQLFQTAPLP